MTTVSGLFLKAQDCVLSVTGSEDSGYGIAISKDGSPEFLNRSPAELIVLDRIYRYRSFSEDRYDDRWTHDPRQEYSSPYGRVSLEGEELFCSAVVTTIHGASVEFTDRYRVSPDGRGFCFSRTAEVLSENIKECGFMTRFSLYDPDTVNLMDYDVFAPARWYKKNRQTVGDCPFNDERSQAYGHTFGSDYSHDYFYIREMALPLPMMAIQKERTGAWLALYHLNPELSSPSEAGLDHTGRMVSEKIQFGSLGIKKKPVPSLGYCYPGSEGNYHTSPIKHSANHPRQADVDKDLDWNYKAHPLETGMSHSYTLGICVSRDDGFRMAMRNSYRLGFDWIQPPKVEADLERIYQAHMDLLDRYCEPYGGAMGVPFSVGLDGRIDSISYQFGFVGQQVSIGYHFLREGYRRGKESFLHKGREILRFWVENALSPQDIPMTWYDPLVPRFRNYPSFTRMVADGCEFVLKAYQLEKEHGNPHPQWLDFCIRVADKFLSLQGEDGSFARAYTWEGTVHHPDKGGTPQILRFFVWMYQETGADKYLDCANRIAEFSYEFVHKPFRYIGGTPDNDNVFDKEAGILVFYGFLELYEVTREPRWLEVAIGAADYTENWIYTYPVPVQGDYIGNPYRQVTLLGQSPVTIFGGAGGDNFMSFTTTYYYRLYRITGDTHYRDYAIFAQNASKSATDWKGTFGYAFPGLSPEGVGAPNMEFAGGFSYWIPWASMAQVEPMCDLEDRYGYKSIEQVEAHREENFSSR